MTGHPGTKHEGVMHKWFGPNRGTHWTIAGSVAVILLGSYAIYTSNRDSAPATAVIIAAPPEPVAAPAPVVPPAPVKQP
jgi:hypothetical protein